MSEADQVEATGFFDWLRTLEPRLGVALTRYADGLELTVAEVARNMPLPR